MMASGEPCSKRADVGHVTREKQTGLENLGPMDWEQTARRIEELKAQESEILGAIMSAPPEQLPRILGAVASAVRTGSVVITSYDWRPALNRLISLSIPWPGPQCQHCGAPLGEPGSENNYGSGVCYFCWEG